MSVLKALFKDVLLVGIVLIGVYFAIGFGIIILHISKKIKLLITQLIKKVKKFLHCN
jgi:hypothetical protein